MPLPSFVRFRVQSRHRLSLGLFDQLVDGAANLEELAKRTDIAKPRVRIIADAMVHLNLWERKGDEYQNSPLAASFLCADGTADLRPLLRFWNHLSYPMWEHLEDSVRTGQAHNRINLPEEQQQIYSEGGQAIQTVPSQTLPNIYDFKDHQRMLDIGGGIGTWLIAA